MNEITFNVLKIVISIVSVIITLYLFPIVKKYLQSKNQDELLAMIQIAVRAAEQTIGSGNGVIKKEEVLNWIHNWLKEKGISITEEQLDQLIEAAVWSMNYE